MMKYKTKSTWHNQIFTVEVERETESSVWIGGRRCAKRSNYENFFNTWGEAHAHLLERAERKASSLRSQLERANAELGNVKGMKHGETRGQ